MQIAFSFCLVFLTLQVLSILETLPEVVKSAVNNDFKVRLRRQLWGLPCQLWGLQIAHIRIIYIRPTLHKT